MINRQHSLAAIALSVVSNLAFVNSTLAQSCTYPANGKVSRNFYRVPYLNGDSMYVSNAYANHGGAFDFIGQGGGTHIVVASLDGNIEDFDDSHTECGHHAAFCNCSNWIGLRHVNGEYSRYYHIQHLSATNLGLLPGMHVTQGQQIGLEGDVGITWGSTSPPRSGPCVPAIPPGTDDCQLHCHFVVIRSTGEIVAPMVCGISGNIYALNSTYPGSSCSSTVYPPNVTLSNSAYSGLGAFAVVQTSNSISASTFSTANQAGVVFHAASVIHLTPGFHANSNSYFRAEIGSNDTTAPSNNPQFYSGPTCPSRVCWGACCFGLVCQSAVNKATCDNLGGVYQGTDTVCNGSDCP